MVAKLQDGFVEIFIKVYDRILQVAIATLVLALAARSVVVDLLCITDPVVTHILSTTIFTYFEISVTV